MSVMIETTEELLALLKKLNLKVSSVDELRHLLATINANYNPEAARQKTGQRIGVTVPGYMAGAAAFASWILCASDSTHTTGGLALIWGAVALVSTAAVIAGAILTGVRRGRTTPEAVPDPKSTFGEELVTGIQKELP